MTMPLSFRLGALTLLLALGASASQAQSSYALTVLKAPSNGGIASLDSTWGIDSSDRVSGTANVVTGWGFSPIFSFYPKTSPFVYRWPASTAASVAGKSLYPKTAGLAAVSPNGRFIVIHGQPRLLYDTVAGKSLGTIPLGGELLPMNNQGTVAAEFATPTPGGGYRHAAATWSLGSAPQDLPAPGATFPQAWAINASGVVAGDVRDLDLAAPLRHAALWVNGQMQLVPEPAGYASSVVGLNDKGQALIRRAPLVSCLVESSSAVPSRCELGIESVVLRDNGVETALMGAGDARHFGRLQLNNAGTVVWQIISGVKPVGWASIGPLTNKASQYDLPSTFIWQKGVLSDLTDWVVAKGAKLPAGAALIDVLAINDKGSMVATMRTPPGNLEGISLVRLTAKP